MNKKYISLITAILLVFVSAPVGAMSRLSQRFASRPATAVRQQTFRPSYPVRQPITVRPQYMRTLSQMLPLLVGTTATTLLAYAMQPNVACAQPLYGWGEKEMSAKVEKELKTYRNYFTEGWNNPDKKFEYSARAFNYNWSKKYELERDDAFEMLARFELQDCMKDPKKSVRSCYNKQGSLARAHYEKRKANGTDWFVTKHGSPEQEYWKNNIVNYRVEEMQANLPEMQKRQAAEKARRPLIMPKKRQYAQ